MAHTTPHENNLRIIASELSRVGYPVKEVMVRTPQTHAGIRLTDKIGVALTSFRRSLWYGLTIENDDGTFECWPPVQGLTELYTILDKETTLRRVTK